MNDIIAEKWKNSAKSSVCRLRGLRRLACGASCLCSSCFYLMLQQKWDIRIRKDVQLLLWLSQEPSFFCCIRGPFCWVLTSWPFPLCPRWNCDRFVPLTVDLPLKKWIATGAASLSFPGPLQLCSIGQGFFPVKMSLIPNNSRHQVIKDKRMLPWAQFYIMFDCVM